MPALMNYDDFVLFLIDYRTISLRIRELEEKLYSPVSPSLRLKERNNKRAKSLAEKIDDLDELYIAYDDMNKIISAMKDKDGAFCACGIFGAWLNGESETEIRKRYRYRSGASVFIKTSDDFNAIIRRCFIRAYQIYQQPYTTSLVQKKIEDCKQILQASELNKGYDIIACYEYAFFKSRLQHYSSLLDRMQKNDVYY